MNKLDKESAACIKVYNEARKTHMEAVKASNAAREAFNESAKKEYEAVIASCAAYDTFTEAYKLATDATAAYNAAYTYTDNFMAQVAVWGVRCEEFDAECSACQAWQKFDADNASPTIRYGAERVNGTDSSGYRTHYDMDKPWCAMHNGEVLRTKSGRLRRFRSESAALATARDVAIAAYNKE